ncbi:MAG: endolytic transglycosylase MltG [Micropepsaceae bacterium]
MRFLLRTFFVLFLLVALIGGVGAWHVWSEFEEPGPDSVDGSPQTVVSLPKGTGLSRIADTLEEQGVIGNSLIFRAGVMYYGKASALKAGEYAIPSGASPRQIMDILIEGKAIVYKLTLPEGLTTAMALDLVAKNTSLEGTITRTPAEGTLLPETYVFSRGTARDALIEKMEQDHTAILNGLWQTRAPNLPFSTKEEAVVLASIVEKETGVASERPRVAAVFVNRLRKGMKLQSDPTIIYGISQGVPLGRGIRQSELEKATPYNTYVIIGLPPTPIANPGKEAIKAVLNPAPTEDLYFVADGSGGHAFAATLADHEKNVQNWRLIEKQRAAAVPAPQAPTP